MIDDPTGNDVNSPTPAHPGCRIGLLHLAYRAGALVDALAVVPLLVPQAAAASLGLHDFHPGADYKYASGIAASLMIGWTGLLLWADRAPVQRRGVFALTLLVVAGRAPRGSSPC